MPTHTHIPSYLPTRACSICTHPHPPPPPHTHTTPSTDLYKHSVQSVWGTRVHHVSLVRGEQEGNQKRIWRPEMYCLQQKCSPEMSRVFHVTITWLNHKSSAHHTKYIYHLQQSIAKYITLSAVKCRQLLCLFSVNWLQPTLLAVDNKMYAQYNNNWESLVPRGNPSSSSHLLTKVVESQERLVCF